LTTIGKYRHLAQASTPAGHFVILAIDHRGNLLGELNHAASHAVNELDLIDFKRDIIGGLIAGASGLLTDPAYGLGMGIAERRIPGNVGLLAPIEVTDYNIRADQRRVSFIPHWSVAKIKRMGGSGVKLLLPYHPDAPDALEKQSLVAQVVDACGEWDIPFYLEPIPFVPTPDRSLSSAELTQITVYMAKQFSRMGVDVLKLLFPVNVQETADEGVWLAACEEVNAACSVPWALLSAGIDYPTFERQARIACEAGASGVIVGRAVWGEAVTLQGEARVQFIGEIAVQRMQALCRICAAYATSAYERISSPDAGFDWYERYPE
jgi:tagatose 1,6-diphosphate aldolase